MARSAKNGLEPAYAALVDQVVPRKERRAAGKALREKVPHALHALWSPPSGRADPVAMVSAANEGRIPHLVPIRHGRMMVSPFTFYRGTAGLMAADLAATPVSGITTQVCGDCHLMNFGGFATPERRVIFDINDFDETMPGPWEWDVKRLAASMVMAARSNGFTVGQQRDSALAMLRSYRERMAGLAEMSALGVWYARIDLQHLVDASRDKETRKRAIRRMDRVGLRNVAEDDFPKLVEHVDGRPTIKEVPPLIFRHAQLNLGDSVKVIARAFGDYRLTLSEDRRVLLDRYRMVDTAMKVVGVGSVGTFCAIALMMADHDDPLFLQVKEARASVLAPHLPGARFDNQGQRVVQGQRLMQSASDIFLGWTRGAKKFGRHFYLRQLRDIKVKPLVDIYNPLTMEDYGAACGHALARAHARSGDPALIAGYLGKGDGFDQAVADFSVAYADQTERDFAAFTTALRAGKLEAAAAF